MVDTSIVSDLLSDDTLKKVFETVLKNRSVLYKDIVGTVSGGQGDPTTSDIGYAVDTLLRADLIKERSTGIKDFDSYSITSDGLTTGRRLSNFSP